ncbi:MAG TPA: MFS transporter [Gammaproteobacteria bacterium]|jgi:predicted MFS family arabinose efflux permease|nr:MFS transporter [Gammaproteobacteria bacterium]
MHNTTHNTPTKMAYPILIISLCAGFLFYKYILQIYPSVITQELMREFQLTGAGLGNLAATFYYTYMIAQLFVGVILDRYSTRWLTGIAIFVCAISTFWFAHTHHLFTAEIARSLMGIGVAFATIAYMKLAAVWFPPRHYAFISGLLASAAMAGAVFGLAPLSLMVDSIGWRESLYLIGILGLVLALLFLIFVRDNPKTNTLAQPTLHKTHAAHPSMADILQVFKSKQNWLLMLYCGLAFSPAIIFGGLWGSPFLEQAYQLSTTEAASMISLMFIGLGFGSPLLGVVASRVGNKRGVMIACTLLSCITFSAILYCHPMPSWLLAGLLFLFGFTLGVFMLTFTIAKESNSLLLTATVVSMINASDAILTGVTEPAIGKLLDLNWDGKIVDGAHYFSLYSYHIGLSVLSLYLLIATLLLFWIKEK